LEMTDSEAGESAWSGQESSPMAAIVSVKYFFIG